MKQPCYESSSESSVYRNLYFNFENKVGFKFDDVTDPAFQLMRFHAMLVSNNEKEPIELELPNDGSCIIIFTKMAAALIEGTFMKPWDFEKKTAMAIIIDYGDCLHEISYDPTLDENDENTSNILFRIAFRTLDAIMPERIKNLIIKDNGETVQLFDIASNINYVMSNGKYYMYSFTGNVMRKYDIDIDKMNDDGYLQNLVNLAKGITD